ncbi:spermine/spermidine N-acetyltransferase [Aquimarina amphilecti]|uniref:Spermine/spermidine N-acetyltransferase n=1 Tax=Aquimarina amphilecti TaxID=1038014 RepID=A0A1H7GTI9_AQUAM|nr:GNAT family N-acetyltransferase [Aquimarina amphilecti]SEK41339.1 spermine/spermidine N-acetyltransferase [Aquimarina amphilecti]
MPSQKINIVKVLLKDKHKLLEIGRQTFYDAFGPPHNTEENIHYYLNQKFTLPKITNEILNTQSKFFFAIQKNEIAGYFKLNFEEAQTEKVKGKSMEIERIYITYHYQGAGFGQQLINKAIKIAKEKKVDFIWLGVWDKNLKAIEFYKRNGFKIFDNHIFMLGSDEQIDNMMKLIL